MGKYRTIVIDVPWKISCNLKDTKYYRCGKKFPYELMSDEDIMKFPIEDFANIDCDLFMWVVQSKLPIAVKIIKKWGFKYHCCLTWDKTNGIGLNGFHRKTELVLYGYKGKMGIDRGKGKYIPTLFKEKLTTHSTKPNIFYELIRIRTQEPRIDIFNRRQIYGFDGWGNESPKVKQKFIEG